MPIYLKLTVKSNKPVLRGVDHYWSVIMDLAMKDRPVSEDAIAAASKATRSDIRDFLRRLVLGGFIEQADDVHYRVIRRQAATPRVRRDGTVLEGVTINQAMWNAMRSPVCRQGFTALDLVQYASTDSVQINRETARTYIQRLAAAGYLVLREAGKPGRLAIWALLPTMNTGPTAPKVLRSLMVYDPNKQAVIGDVIAEEDA